MDLLTDPLINEFNLLRRHLLVLKAIKSHEPIGIIKLSEILDMPQHKVRYSLRILEKERLIEATQDGAVITDEGRKLLSEIPQYIDEYITTLTELKKEFQE